MPINVVQWGRGNMSPGVGVGWRNKSLSREDWNNIESCPRGRGGGGGVRLQLLYNLSEIRISILKIRHNIRISYKLRTFDF